RARPAQGLGAADARRAVRAVGDHGEALQGALERGDQVLDVGLDRALVARDRADVRALGAVPLLAEAGLDRVLDLVGQLVAAPVACTRWARPGVGSTSASSTSTPAAASPAHTAAERKSPDGRVSRATIARGRVPPKAPSVPSTWAAPTDSSTASSAVMSPFA